MSQFPDLVLMKKIQHFVEVRTLSLICKFPVTISFIWSTNMCENCSLTTLSPITNSSVS